MKHNDEGALADSERLFKEAERISQSLPDSLVYEKLTALGRSEIGLSRTYWALDRRSSAIESARSAVTRFSGMPDQALWARENLAQLQLSFGRPAEAEKTLRDQVEQSLEAGVEEKAVIAAVLSLLRIQERRGYGSESARLIERCMMLASRAGLQEEVASLHLARAKLNVGAIASDHEAPPFSRAKQARTDANRAVDIFRELGDERSLAESLAFLAELRVSKKLQQ